MSTGRRGYHSPLRAEQVGQTRRRVLAAARELFLACGYTATTVAAVAQAAGVSPDTIYVSLGGKRGLLEGVYALAVSDPDDRARREQQHRRDQASVLTGPHQRLRQLIAASSETLARTSPVHAVIRGAADGHPFAAELRTQMLHTRLQIQSRNLRDHLGPALCDGITPPQAAERYSALLSPELYHLLTVERHWPARQYQTWVADLLDRDLLGWRRLPAAVTAPSRCSGGVGFIDAAASARHTDHHATPACDSAACQRVRLRSSVAEERHDSFGKGLRAGEMSDVRLPLEDADPCVRERSGDDLRVGLDLLWAVRSH